MPDDPEGTIRGAIGRDPRNRMKYAIRTEGKPSVTHYALRERLVGTSELTFKLETGRTHQIRVHMAALGHPVLNDPIYGRSDSRLPLPGQALHAWRLRFKHPRTKQMLSFESEPPRGVSRDAGDAAPPGAVIGDFVLHATSGGARRATLTTAHGDVATPCFMPVGTLADVKLLEPRDLHEIGSRIVLANTYHLWLRPGRETLVAAGGIHRFMAWDGPILTDSGGFQVFSLESRREIDDDGVTFRSHLDGSTHRFTPENVVAFQEDLGVDVAMALDQCVKLPSSREELAGAVARTTAWARRCARRAAARGSHAAVRHRAGRSRGGSARAQRGGARRAGPSGIRHRRAFGRRDARGDGPRRAVHRRRCCRRTSRAI